MLAPLYAVQRNAILYKLPKWAQLSQEGHSLLNRLQYVINLALGRESSDTKSDTAVCILVTAAKRT